MFHWLKFCCLCAWLICMILPSPLFWGFGDSLVFCLGLFGLGLKAGNYSH